MPSFEKYMEVGELEVAVILACITVAGIFMSMKEAADWLKSRPEFFKSLCTKGHLMNDIAGFEVQMHKSFLHISGMSTLLFYISY